MRTRLATTLLLLLSTSLVAQPPSTGLQGNPITVAFRGRIMGLQRSLAQAFDSIPESKFGYKPTPAQLTIGYIAQHVASDNYIFCNAFGSMKAAVPARETATADSVKAAWPKDTLVAQLEASFAFCESALAQVDDAKLADQVPLTYGGHTRMVSRAAMVLGHALDLEDHYSQIANYMRLNGMLPPTALPRRRM